MTFSRNRRCVFLGIIAAAAAVALVRGAQARAGEERHITSELAQAPESAATDASARPSVTLLYSIANNGYIEPCG